MPKGSFSWRMISRMAGSSRDLRWKGFSIISMCRLWLSKMAAWALGRRIVRGSAAGVVSASMPSC